MTRIRGKLEVSTEATRPLTAIASRFGFLLRSQEG